MKLLSACLILLFTGDSLGFQVTPNLHSRRVVKLAEKQSEASPSRSLVVCHMLPNNDSLNSNASSSQSPSQLDFHNKKAIGEVAKPSHDDQGSHISPRNQHCGLRMAHGAICPETIAQFETNDNPAIRRFVETYHKRGPLACEDLLSDPEVLPHLTKAMRDIYF